jgi:hypothetical protein
MESQGVPEIGDEASEINQQENKRERVRHVGERTKDWREQELTRRGSQKEAGCQAVE